MDLTTQEYHRLYYYKKQMMDACRNHITVYGCRQKMSPEEIQEAIKEYKIQYELKKQRLADKKAKKEARRRYKFIYC